MLHPEQRLRYPQVCTLVGLAQNSINELVKAGEFPQPERDGRRCTRWRAGDVLDYLAARRERLLAQTAAPEPTVITTRRRKARA
jgi:prophage regulatory protein